MEREYSAEFRALLAVLEDLCDDGTMIVNDDAELHRVADRIYNCGVPGSFADSPIVIEARAG